jgi:hypothetical protein
MFDRTLGIYPQRKVHIELSPGAKPMHSRPYPVPHMHLITFKCDLDHFVEIGVLVPTQESEWAPPSFNIQKKDGRVTGSVTYTSSTKSSSADNILY